MNKKELYSDCWNYKSFEVLNTAFADLTCLPSSVIQAALIQSRKTMIEVIENRSKSTAYRIRLTGLVYHTKMEDQTIIYNNVTEYISTQKEDILLNVYDYKKIVFSVRFNSGITIVSHEREPYYDVMVTEGGQITSIIPREGNSIEDKTIRKARAFINNYLKE